MAVKPLETFKYAGTELAKRISVVLNISEKDTYIYEDNTMVLDQIEACSQNGIGSFTRGVGSLIATIVNDIPTGHLKLYPSECNSADYLTRVRTVEDIFGEGATWFTPHPHFNQTVVHKFERVQSRKVFDDKPDKNSVSQAE